MADTLIREGIAYGSQPLSPVPQYWDGASYGKVQGANGATRGMNYNSSGVEIFTGAVPGSMKLTATSTVVISGTSTAVISGTATVVISGTSTMVISGTSTINFSGNGTVEVVTSAGGTARFSLTNPGIIGLVSGGTQANAWSANATISSGATSNSYDANNNSRISAFGAITCTATLTIMFELSQDNTNWYTFTSASTVTVSAGTSVSFGVVYQPGNRYVRLTTSGASATITATIAGK